MEQGSIWDRLPTPLKWVVGVLLVIYFVGGLIAPLFWGLK